MAEYRVWECQNCGWIYDEAKGWPEDNITPGTRWEDIPEDWCCPQCGASKRDFAMLEVKRSHPPQSPTPPPTAPKAATATHIWECMVCGWVYDEAKGCPEEGIAPGTRWEQIPEDWCCPQCGISKEEFDMVLVTAAPVEPLAKPDATEAQPSRDPLVILGTGLAGYNLAKEFRKLDSDTPLLLITSDDGTFYSKPLLSASLSHGRTAQQLSTNSAEEMARELEADILVHTRVTGINPDTRALTVQQETADHSAKIHYDRLVLATGAHCRPLPCIEGDAHTRLFRINSLKDYHRFRTALVGRQRVLVIGAGLIGCEFANDLVQADFSVDLVDPLAWPLASLLPEAAGRDLQGALESRGVRFHCASAVQKLLRRPQGLLAQLDNGQTIEADIALAALGLQANTALAEAAGLAIHRGITVDRQLQTSDPNIYALGDCAEVDGHLLFFVAPLMACARALAKTLSGQPTPIHYGVIPVAIKTTLRPTTVCPPPPHARGRWQIDSDDSGVCAEFRSGQGQLLGFALTGAAITRREPLSRECEPMMGEP
ncbi:FAD-dependent oxidoreductase [Microbulbifer sp. 2304DJ12-6]|uniref:FAD-dependent oxidoreductase n=1 Tax=Microbulbifer sp. 2304DJ12-6 TaxID=3233340 RepID=UPI0039B067DF